MLSPEDRQEIHEQVRATFERLHGPVPVLPYRHARRPSLAARAVSDDAMLFTGLPPDAAGVIHGGSRFADE